MKNKTSFIKYIQSWSIIIIITIGVSIITIDVIDSYQDFNIRADQMREDHIDRQKQIIKREVERVVDMILYEKEQSEDQVKSKIESRVYEACAIVQNIYQENKNSKNEDEIQKIILNTLTPIRFEQNRGYYFIIRVDGVAILFPGKSDLNGKNLLLEQYPEIRSITKNMIDIVEQAEEGFYQYYWKKPDAEGDDFKKISFVKRLNLYGWFIGTGLYIDDVTKRIKENLLLDISRIRFGKEGYIFVNKFNGDALVSNGKLLAGTQKLWEVFDADPEKMKNIFDKEYKAAHIPDGDYIYYSFYKLTDMTKDSPKASFIYGIPELEWIIGAGVYLDDVETEIALIQSGLNDKIKSRILQSLLITISVVALLLFIFSRLNRRLKKDFNLFSLFFNRAVFSDDPIDRGVIQFAELDQMAENANKMIMDRRQAEESLRKSEANLRAVFEAAKNVAFVKVEGDSENGEIVDFSPGAQQIFGYAAEEVLGKPIMILYSREEIDKVAWCFKEMNEYRKSCSGESTLERKSGETFPSLFTAHPVFDDDGIMAAVICVFIDITQRKKAEEELRKTENLKSVGILAGGIAHDFNNILMGLFGNILLAKEELPEDHPGFKPLEDAGKSMDRAIRLAKQLLTFSKGGAPVKERVNLDTLIEEVVRFDLSGSNVLPVFKHGDDLWPVEADRGQIQQVFSNLTINSKQAMPDGGHLYITMVNVDISANEIQGLDEGKYIKITVADEGIGIDRNHLGRIFDPYFTTKHAGNGLGLTTVYSIIKSHGGSISVDSKHGKGATFKLYLPASDQSLLIEKGRPSSKSIKIDQTTRVLVMDDEKMICDVVSRMLKNEVFAIETALDGMQMLKIYKDAMDAGEPFDVVIMDLTIPGGVGGKDAIREILKINPEAKVIVSSGYANDPVMANYSEYGFRGIVAKPYKKKKLLEVLSHVLTK
ncbi:MAG: cache domain-containing protein [Candidatus Krumholzibacteriota bacterium]|nr:cache domain-containing protein [Candidatus Krumholzibacteriota bacterium]